MAWFGLCFAVFATGCSSTRNIVPYEPARVMQVTPAYDDLAMLPPPREQIVVAVYRFRDQTGQYKTSDSGTSWSTAVTQGATSMLMKALDDSGWFIPLEREGISNLLNERKIISATRENYSASDGGQLPPLPPLMYAGILIEGGIISYDSNIVTGGYGARYHGLGGSSQVRKDQVTIYLRAVSTQTGRVLKTVTTTKSILSEQVDIGLYRYVEVQRLLELEAGYSTNEPPSICVLEAIEKAVANLVIEGINDNLWALQNPDDSTSPVIQSYYAERRASIEPPDYFEQPSNRFGRTFIDSENVSVTVAGSAMSYAGDYEDSKQHTGFEASVHYGMARWFSLGLGGGYGKIADKQHFTSDLAFIELRPQIHLLRFRRWGLSGFAGLGAVNFWAENKSGIEFDRTRDYGGWEPQVSIGGMLEYFINQHTSVLFSIDSHYTASDQMDGLVHGDLNDSFWNYKAGLCFYFPD